MDYRNSFNIICEEIEKDRYNALYYVQLGDFYRENNINQAYICYEQAMGLASRCNSQELVGKAQALMDECRGYDGFEVAMSEYRNELGWYIIGPAYFYTMENVYKEIDYYTNFISSIFPDILDNNHLKVLDEKHAEWMRHFKR